MVAAVASAIASATGLSALHVGVQVAANVIVGAALAGTAAVLAPRPDTPNAGARTLNVRAPVQPRRIIYGQALVGGTMVFAESFETVNGSDDVPDNFAMILALAGHEVEEIGDVYFFDDLLTLTSFTSNSGHSLQRITNLTKYGTFTTVEKFLGTDDQLAFDFFVDILPSGDWTANHRLRGVAYLAVKLGWQGPDTFTTGLPTITAVVKGKKVYDPRNVSHVIDDASTWEWSSNPALCIADFLRGNFAAGLGCGFDDDDIDWDSVSAAANVCDEDIALVDGGTEKRYSLNGTIEASESRREVVRRMLTSMAGTLTETGGLWRLHAGAAKAVTRPAITLDDARGPIQVRWRVPRSELANEVRGTYVDPDKNWQETDFPPYAPALYLAEDNSEVATRDITLPFTTSPVTAQRLAKIELERLRQQISVTFPAKLSLLDVQAWDTVSLTIDRYGWDEKKFRVVGWTLSSDQGVDLELREEADAMWDWSLEETTVDPAPNTNLPDPFTVAAPTGVTIASDPKIEPDGTTIPRIKISWTAPTGRAFVARYEVQYRISGATDWEPTVTAPNGVNYVYVVGVVAGESYDARVRAISNFGAPSSYVSNDASVTGDETAPAGTSNFSVAALIQAIRLEWTNPSDSDFSHVRVFRRTDSNTPSAPDVITGVAGGRGRRGKYTDSQLTAGTTYFYTLRAVDFTGNESGFSQTLSATPRNVITTDVTDENITTPKIADDAVINKQGAFTAGTVGLVNGANDVAATSLTVDADGSGKVLIVMFTEVVSTGPFDLTVSLLRDNTDFLYTSQSFAMSGNTLQFPFSYVDEPGAGSVTYELRVTTSGFTGPGVAQNRSIAALELRK